MENTRSLRILLYCLGLVIMALGFILNVKSSLGVTPILSIAYCVAYLTGVSFPDMSMILFVICFIIGMILRKRKPHWTDFLQLAYAVVFTRVMSAFAALLPSPESLAMRVVFLLLAIVCVGTGGVLTLAMRIVPNPADFMVNTIGTRIHKSLGLTKNIIDIILVACVVIIALITHNSILECGVGIGTLVPMVLVGRWMSLINHFFLDKFDHIHDHGYIRIFDEKGNDRVAT